MPIREEKRREGPGENTHTCLTSVHIWPTAVRKLIPAIHSFVLSRVSRAKSWRWVTSLSKTYFVRGSGSFELMMMVFSVIVSALRSFTGGIFILEGSMSEVGVDERLRLQLPKLDASDSEREPSSPRKQNKLEEGRRLEGAQVSFRCNFKELFTSL